MVNNMQANIIHYSKCSILSKLTLNIKSALTAAKFLLKIAPASCEVPQYITSIILNIYDTLP